jgi:Uncharacterized protein conserved in bacteria
MEYEWDEAKRFSNIEKHQVDILEALLIFENWVLTEPEARIDYGEARFRSIGFVENDCYVVIHTERSGITRLISAWKGGRRDRRKYQAGYARRNPGNEGTG